MIEWNLKILRNEYINAGYFLLSLEAPKDFPNPLPGQFIHLKVGEPPNFFLRRPFSIFSYENSKLQILYRVVGRGTKSLSMRKKGEKINILGPLGNGFSLDLKKISVLVGGGRGIAPLHFLWEEMRKKKLNSFIYLGFKNKEEAVLAERFFNEFLLSTEDGSIGEKGKVTDILRKYFPSKGNLKLFSCGPRQMLKEVNKICEKENIECEVSMESELGCGLGICQSCVIKTIKGYKKVCKDGPVFNSKEIIWELI